MLTEICKGKLWIPMHMGVFKIPAIVPLYQLHDSNFAYLKPL